MLNGGEIMKINENLKQCRLKHNFTQTQIAAALGIDRSTYSYYELGKTVPSIGMLTKIAKIFNTDVFELLDGEKNFEHMNNSGSSYSGLQNDKPLSSATLSGAEKVLVLLFRQLDESSKNELLKRAETLREKQYEDIE